MDWLVFQYRGHPLDHDLDGGSILLRIGIGERETTLLLLLVKPAERTSIKVTNGQDFLNQLGKC